LEKLQKAKQVSIRVHAVLFYLKVISVFTTKLVADDYLLCEQYPITILRAIYGLSNHKSIERVLTMPKATPVNAVWNSKLGVGNSGSGYAKHSNKERLAQKNVTAQEKNNENILQL
jgi:hypothetical protein